MFTYAYQQPAEYRFSLDSIGLAEFVAQQIKHHPQLNTLRVLDVCAGCGVVGLELSWYVRQLKQIDFLEIQDCYTTYFYENVRIVNRPELQLRWHLLNYDVLREKTWQNKFDVIVSNPPYFQAGHGMYSPSSFKNRCRFFLDSSFENFVRALENTLAPQGKAYFLLRPLKQHGCDLFTDMQAWLSHTTRVTKIGKMRGTDIVCLEKK